MNNPTPAPTGQPSPLERYAEAVAELACLRSEVERLTRERDEAREALAIAHHQLNPFVHPYTCGIDSSHIPLVPLVTESGVVLVCKGTGKMRFPDMTPEPCPYTQQITRAPTPEDRNGE